MNTAVYDTTKGDIYVLKEQGYFQKLANNWAACAQGRPLEQVQATERPLQAE